MDPYQSFSSSPQEMIRVVCYADYLIDEKKRPYGPEKTGSHGRVEWLLGLDSNQQPSGYDLTCLSAGVGLSLRPRLQEVR